MSPSHLLKPTDGVGRGGGLTRSGGKAESRESTSKRRLSRGQQQCQVQREMERGKPELRVPLLTKRAVSGTRGKSGGRLKGTHKRETEAGKIWEMGIDCDRRESRVSHEKSIKALLLYFGF